jgi:arsenate reductase
MTQLNPILESTVATFNADSISEERKAILKPLISYVQQKLDSNQHVCLNFICTHNSRRSQFSQVWAQTAASYFQLPVSCYSGGVEETAFHPNAIASLKRAGFVIETPHGENPIVLVSFNSESTPIRAFSKLFDHAENKAEAFAAVMTCSHADENCPFIPGTEKRIALNYDDPKEFDGTPKVESGYDERSMQIGNEMWYVFSSITRKA